MTDLHIIGAGPAGAFAGICALKTGANVLISEEHKTAGEPVHCSGLISASGLEQMSDIVDFKKIIINPIRRANIHAKTESLSLTFNSPKAYVVSRGGFDELAMQKFEQEGGKAEFGSKISSRTQLKSKNIIGADGPISSVARMFDFPKLEKFAPSYQAEFVYDCPDLSAVEVFFDPALCPGFIGWIIPLSQSRAKIGLGVSSDANLHIAKQNFLSRLKLQNAKKESEFSALIPLAPRKKTGICKDGYNVCLAGDSAGQVKASSGGGVFFGSSCARIAGQNYSNPQEYERLWRKKYGFDLSLHSLAREGANILSGDGLDLCVNFASALKFDRLLSRSGEMDEYSKMLSFNTLCDYIGIIARM
ncbi:MAG: NAD(P)/FAD-dependent oxidoreductase [Candidatus Micrarchaeia archaeon]